MIDPVAIDALGNAANRREALQALVQRSALVHRCKSNAASQPDELSDTIAANANRFRSAVQELCAGAHRSAAKVNAAHGAEKIIAMRGRNNLPISSRNPL